MTETIFNGNRNYNGVRQAETNVLGARETLRNTEQTVLQNGATAYMDVLRDTAILDLRKNNIIVLEEQLRQTRDRFNVGEVTRTDVAQAASSLASARSDYFTAQANLQTSIANYHQVIGVDPNSSRSGALGRNPAAAYVSGGDQRCYRPASGSAGGLAAGRYRRVAGQAHRGRVDADGVARGQVSRITITRGIPGYKLFNGAMLGEVSVPIYTGGEVDARVRQAKELLSQAELEADLQRTQVRSSVVSNWGLLEFGEGGDRLRSGSGESGRDRA